ncbi:MAG: hypothetical protein SVV03_02465 [Candidatus Nanohaloarchaea archaeon]|nr:hypothetical protein [Candidatus Nanohaloarchaea archaeon]
MSSENGDSRAEKQKNVVRQFISRPREAHSIGYGFMPTYLGAVHGLTVPGVGVPLQKLALAIAVLLLAGNSKTARKGITKVIPFEVEPPKDVTREAIYFWFGITALYAAQHLYGFITPLL